MEIPRPKLLLEKYKKELTAEWKLLQHFHDAKASGDTDFAWEDWCFLPIAGYYAAISAGGSRRMGREEIYLVGVMAALDAWRVSQGIYRYDQTVFQELLDSKVDDKIPHEILLRLPEWCVYIETPNLTFMNHELYGFFVHCEDDMNDRHKELRFVFDTETGLFPYPLHLRDTVTESVNSFMRTAAPNIPEGFGAKINIPEIMKETVYMILKLLPLVLYLCSEEPEYSTEERPKRATAVKVKKGYKYFDAEKTVTHKMGYRIGKFIRDYKAGVPSETASEGTGRTVAPHIRKAHFQTYWTEKGRITPVVKWIPPLPINVKYDDDIIPTIKTVN